MRSSFFSIVTAFLIIGASLLLLANQSGLFSSLQNTQSVLSAEDIATSTPTLKPTVEPKNITVSSPVSGATVGSPIMVTGRARVVDNTVYITLKDLDGNIIARDTASVVDIDSTGFGSFSKSLTYQRPKAGQGVLEVYQAESGSSVQQYKVILSLIFSQDKVTTFNLYYPNNSRGGLCYAVYPSQQFVYNAKGLEQMSLDLLLQGPTLSDKKDGFYTSIDPGVKINSFSIEKGVAHIDFDRPLDQGVQDACRGKTVISQVKNTLEQFNSIQRIDITINHQSVVSS